MHHDWLKRWALYAPSQIAFSDADSSRSWSYESLYRISCRLAVLLRDERGIRRGDRVAVLAPNEMGYVPLFFALQRLGAILVPINFRLASPEISHILRDSGASLFIYHKRFQEAVDGVPLGLRSQQWLFDGPGGLEGAIQEAELAAAAAGSLRGRGWAIEMDSAGDHDACMILYTSGTTGRPKGALITNGMLFWNSLNTALRLNLRQDDVALGFLPFFHTGGWNVLLTPFVHRGARTVLMRKFDPARALELCEREHVTVLFGVPTTMDMMAREPGFDGRGQAVRNLSSVRYAIVGGEPMPIELIKIWQAKGVPIRQGYGLTEFGPNVFSLNEEDSLRKIGSIGFPNFYVEAKVIDEHGSEIFDGRVGELALRGPVCTPGYWRNEVATREAIRDGWLLTGDLVRRDEDGYYYVAGRKKDMYISGGENVYPVEIERLLTSHPAVREAAVIGVPDSRWGEVGKAYVALKDGETASADDLLGFCAGKLAKFKIPKHWEFRPELPKGDSGKILKRLLAFPDDGPAPVI